jgi:calcium-dependent protein kinase
VQEKYGKITKDYVLLNPPIGKGTTFDLKPGAYGEVRKGLHRVTEAIRAIKIISK